MRGRKVVNKRNGETKQVSLKLPFKRETADWLIVENFIEIKGHHNRVIQYN